MVVRCRRAGLLAGFMQSKLDNMSSLAIIIPVYNVAGYVRQCIQSVLDQIEAGDQIVVVEDHSTDNSLHIVEEMARRHSEILLVRPEANAGLGRARNLGIQKSTADYLLFLDSDDYFFPGSLDAIRARCDATNPDLVMFDYARVYWNGRKARNMLGGLLEGHPEPVVLSEVPDLLKIINIATNKAYRRVFLEENDLWFPSGYYEDVPFTYPAFCLAESISLLDRVCYAYRQRRTGSILLSTDSRHFELLKQFETALERFQTEVKLRPWLPVVWERAANHIVAVLAKGEQRLPRELRKQFFMDASDLLNRHAPSVVPYPPGNHGLKYKLIVSGNFRGFEALKRVNQQRIRGRRYRKQLEDKVGPSVERLRRFRPVDPNVAVFSTMWGQLPRGNPLAIAEALATYAPAIQPIWVIAPQHASAARQLGGFEFVEGGTKASQRLFQSAKFFVNDVNFPATWEKRDDQTYLQTQHGTPLKFIGLDVQHHPIAADGMNFSAFLRRIDLWDYNLSSSQYSTEILKRAFPASHELLEYGYPRNDVLVNPPEGIREETRAQLSIPEGHLAVLYTPTHRDGVDQLDLGFDPVAFLKGVPDDVTLIIRSHHRYGPSSGVRMLQSEGRIVDGSDLPEIAPLYLASDVLICDYSSTMFDFANLGRPIVIYGEDWAEYRRLRGTYFDIMEEPPGVVTRSMEELCRAFVSETYRSPSAMKQLDIFQARFCEFDDGRASERVVRKVFLGEEPEAPEPLHDPPVPLATWNVDRPG